MIAFNSWQLLIEDPTLPTVTVCSIAAVFGIGLSGSLSTDAKNRRSQRVA